MRLNVKTIQIIFLIGLVLFMTGCGESLTGAKAKVATSHTDLPAYDGPKAKVAIADFEWKVGGNEGATITGPGGQVIWQVSEYNGYTTGLRDMLTTSMVQTKRFKVFERQNMASIQGEMSLQEEGYTDSSGIQRGQIQGADLLVMGAVTGWDPDASGRSVGLGGWVPNIPVIGRGSFGQKKSKMALDIRIVDARTSEVLSSTCVEGEAKDFKVGVGGFGWGSAGVLGGSLGTYKNTPMEKAIRTCLDEAVKYVVSNTPNQYMKVTFR